MAHKKAGGSSRNGRDSQVQAPGRKSLRRRTDPGRQHHHPSARHPGSSRRECRHGQGSHAVRQGRRARVKFSTKGADATQDGERRSGLNSS